MNPIVAFLSRYRGIRPPDEAVLRQVSTSIEVLTGGHVDPSKIVIRRKTALIEGSSALKSEIRLRRAELLAHIRTAGYEIEDVC